MSINPQAEKAAPKVKYEWDMFRWVNDQIQAKYPVGRGERAGGDKLFLTSQGTLPGEGSSQHNMLPYLQDDERRMRYLLLEDFLLHARVLCDFLFTKPISDDVSAKDFFDNPNEWEKKEADLCPYFAKNRKRVNKKLAHLTYSRLTEANEWDITSIYSELAKAWQQFLSALPADTQAWFR